MTRNDGKTACRDVLKEKSATLNENCASAVWTRLELATPCVTGTYSNQLNYHTINSANIEILFLMTKLKLNLFCDTQREISFSCPRRAGLPSSVPTEDGSEKNSSLRAVSLKNRLTQLHGKNSLCSDICRASR